MSGPRPSGGGPTRLRPSSPGCAPTLWQNDEGYHTAYLSDFPGWYRTGDIGSRDADGYFRVHDRKKNMIISGGENIYPAEVERALAALPAIAGAVVFGIPDDDWGQIVAAVIAVHDGAALDGRAVRMALRDQLAGYKLPRALAVCSLAELPIGSSGKALRRAARAQFADQLVRVD